MRRAAIPFGVIAVLLGTALSAAAETAPLAVDDWVETDGKTVQIHVLANDSGDFDPSTLFLVTEPTQGMASVIATGSPKVKYSATGSGTDTFQYSVCNSAGACSTATITVNIAPVATTTTAVVATTTAAPTPTTTTSPVVTLPPTTAPTAPAMGTTLPVTTAPTIPATTLPSAVSSSVPSDPFAGLAIGPARPMAAAGTTVGEPHEIDIAEDVRFLGRSGADTLKLVAAPAVMVSGILGFLLVGLPQNALGGMLGFLVAKRRGDKKDGDQQI
ncbi:MAG: Ig-like domain-containing protein [Acidimicrobiia bacterium]